MKKIIKKLNVKNLYLIYTLIGKTKYLSVMNAGSDLPLKHYGSAPIEKSNDFVKLFEKFLGGLDWHSAKLTDEHKERYKKMEKNIIKNSCGNYIVCNYV